MDLVAAQQTTVNGAVRLVVTGQVVSGGVSSGIVLRRLANGAADTSFGSGGVATTGAGHSYTGLLVRNDGSIVLGVSADNTSRSPGTWDGFPVRLSSEGAVEGTGDPVWVDGWDIAPFVGNMLLDAQGMLLGAGYYGSGNGGAVLVRYAMP